MTCLLLLLGGKLLASLLLRVRVEVGARAMVRIKLRARARVKVKVGASLAPRLLALAHAPLLLDDLVLDLLPLRLALRPAPLPLRVRRRIRFQPARVRLRGGRGGRLRLRSLGSRLLLRAEHGLRTEHRAENRGLAALLGRSKLGAHTLGCRTLGRCCRRLLGRRDHALDAARLSRLGASGGLGTSSALRAGGLACGGRLARAACCRSLPRYAELGRGLCILDFVGHSLPLRLLRRDVLEDLALLLLRQGLSSVVDAFGILRHRACGRWAKRGRLRRQAAVASAEQIAVSA